MKPFDLEKAKASAPVCTRDGKDARIICFNAKGEYPIIALIQDIDDNEHSVECAEQYTNKGEFYKSIDIMPDLMMKEIHHEGWINIYKSKTNTECGGIIYNSEKDAKKYKSNNANYITTIKIEWDE